MSSALADFWDETSFLQPPSDADWRERSGSGFTVTPRKSKRPKVSLGISVPVDVRRVCGVEVPDGLIDVADAVEKSEYILRLPDNWDDEGSPRYERETWERAAKFVIQNAIALWRKERVRTETPAIRNGPEASIDIHWDTPTAQLLINVPSAHDRPATFYGIEKRLVSKRKEISTLQLQTSGS